MLKYVIKLTHGTKNQVQVRQHVIDSVIHGTALAEKILEPREDSDKIKDHCEN